MNYKLYLFRVCFIYIDQVEVLNKVGIQEQNVTPTRSMYVGNEASAKYKHPTNPRLSCLFQGLQ